VIWEQLPVVLEGSGWAMSSQEDVCYPFESWIADNFIGTGDEVTAVRWWGAFWNGNPDLPTEVIVEFWTPGPDGQCPAFSTRVHASRTSSFSQMPVELPGGNPGFEYQAMLPDPFVPLPGEAYFVSIQLALCYPPQWGITMGGGDGHQCCLGGQWNGSWAPAETVFGYPHESAFVLYSGYATPTEPSTWSRIKGQFRPGGSP
jgi:hypothetical protein